jgi:prevent-host-death family protein
MVVAGRRLSIDRPYDEQVREIEVRELAANLSSVLREVEAGGRIVVVEDGRPVAELVPAESPEEKRQRMIAAGKITPRRHSLPKNPPPPIKTQRPASAIILAEREEDR